MKSQRHLQKILASIRLIILSLGFFLPLTAIVRQQATSKFGKCFSCRPRVLDCRQRCELGGGHDILGRFLCLLETAPLMASLALQLNIRSS